jgi:hypothetical protein
MRSNNRISLSGMLLSVVLAVSHIGCGGGEHPPAQIIGIVLSNTSATVQAGATFPFSAHLLTSPNNADVNWTITCTAASCGAVSPTSGVSTTYAAPPTPPATNLIVTLTATLINDPTESLSATITVPSVAVSLAPSAASVGSGGKQQFTATVIGDSSNGGVIWSMIKSWFCPPSDKSTCGAFGQHSVSCDSSCGTLSSGSTGSSTPVTYTAPGTPPIYPSGTSSRQLSLIATSVTNSLASTGASITVLPISLSVSPTSASVAVNATQQFTATVTNDGTSSGVSWTLTQNGAACAPGCGTITPASTANGAAATYTPPTTAAALPLVTVTATSVEDTTKSSSASVTLTTSSGSLACGAGSGSESLLKGQYAFLLYSFGQFAGGSFTADGTGKVTSGEEDIQASPQPTGTDVNINPSGSAYAVGPDHRGCAALTNANGTTLSLRFALDSINSSSIATAGHIIEFDDTTGKGTRAAGSIRLQDATSFSASQFKGNYALGLGWILGNGAMAGTFNSDGMAAITSNTIDADFAGTVTSNVTSTPGGSFTCCSPNGRGTLELNNSSLGLGTFAIYMINSSDVFLVSDIVDGEAIGIPSGTTFSQASLSGVSILRESAQSSAGPIVHIATATSDGKGTITVNDNINNAGTFTTSSTALNYVVAPSGRVAVSGGSTPMVLYLHAQNQGFLLGTDSNGTFGILEPQAAGSFSNASFSGAYAFGIEGPLASTATMESGIITADGNGNATGTTDQSGPTGLTQNQSFNFTSSFPANGVGNVGSGTTAILISGNKLVFINNTSPNPTITVVEK